MRIRSVHKVCGIPDGKPDGGDVTFRLKVITGYLWWKEGIRVSVRGSGTVWYYHPGTLDSYGGRCPSWLESWLSDRWHEFQWGSLDGR